MMNIAETEAGSVEGGERAADRLQGICLREDRVGEPKTGGSPAPLPLPAERTPEGWHISATAIGNGTLSEGWQIPATPSIWAF